MNPSRVQSVLTSEEPMIGQFTTIESDPRPGVSDGKAPSRNADHADWGRLWLEGRRGSTWGRRHQYTPADWNDHWREAQGPQFDQSGRVAWILERLPDLPPRRVLDVACGTGLITLPLARAGHVVTGIDVSIVGIDRLCSDAETEGLHNLRAIAADWRTVDPADVGTDYDVAIVTYGLGTVEPRVFLERMFAAAATVVVVEPAGSRHWQHPEFWPLFDGLPFDPGPDHRMIEKLLRQMGHAPRTETGSYQTRITFADMKAAVSWLLGVARVDPARGEHAARTYLNERLRPVAGGLVLEQTQSIAMLKAPN